MDSELIIDLVRHMKAKNRAKWTEDDLDRPLSKLGRLQAEMHAGVMAEHEPIVALYTSPALRCRQTLRPLAELLGLELRIEPLLAETHRFASLPIGAVNPLLSMLQGAHRDGGRVVACSHADTIPAFIDSLKGRTLEGSPTLIKGFGGWYRVRVTGDSVDVEHVEAPDGLPTD
jgi:8-oxo-dGTP diphosphatase